MLHDGLMQVRSGKAAPTIWPHGGECKFAGFCAGNRATSKEKTLFESDLPQIGAFAVSLWQPLPIRSISKLARYLLCQ
jgi:hypothetical protein